MTVALIVALSIAVLYLAHGWSGSRLENASLRAKVASLKRQLARRAGAF